MNILLFETIAEAERIPGDDPRARHVRQVLRLGVGDAVFVGVVNGLRGKGTIIVDNAEGLELEINWEPTPPVVHPLRLLVGLPRPHTAKRVLFEASCLGVAAIDFFQAEKGEPSYALSKLWSTDEWRERLLLGAEQAFATQLPTVNHFPNLAAAVEASQGACLALDVYEGIGRLSELVPPKAELLTLAIGSERGWSPKERDTLRNGGFHLASLGERVLRTETAVVAGVSVALASMGRV